MLDSNCFFDDVKHFLFLLAFTETTSNQIVKSFPKTEEESNIDVLGSQKQRSKNATKSSGFLSWLTPWKSSGWSVVAVCSLHVFRSYQEVGGSPPVRSVAPLVEVPTLLKRKIKTHLNRCSS